MSHFTCEYFPLPYMMEIYYRNERKTQRKFNMHDILNCIFCISSPVNTQQELPYNFHKLA